MRRPPEPCDGSLRHSNTRVLLIGWDAADWKIIMPMLQQGHMPHLQALMNRGSWGDLLTLQPVLSPMLWNSIASGHRPDAHGVHGFTEVDPVTNSVRAVGSTSRKCKALWNIVTQRGGRAHVVNWYASHPAEPINGICISDFLSRHLPSERPSIDSVHPANLYNEFVELCMQADEVDEQTLHLFVPRFAEVDQDKDHRLAVLAKLLAESFTVHNFGTRVVADDNWDLAAIYYPGIDHFCHGFINYHPPKPDHISQQDFDLYQDVVAGAYRLHDLFLGRLVQLAGPETSIILISDHGFHSDHLRPRSIPKDPVGPVVQHRDHGIFVAAGKNIKANHRVYGAGLLDIAPTILTMLNLPIGQDMAGHVLVDAFAVSPEISSVESWEKEPGDCGMHPPDFVAPSRDYSLMLEHFAALGYVDREQIDGPSGPEVCNRENQWHLAQSLVFSGQTERAADLLLELCIRWPYRRWYALELVEAFRKMGMVTDARRLIEALVCHHADSPQSRYLLGMAYLEEKRGRESVELLQSVQEDFGDAVELHLGLGRAFLRLRRPRDAENSFHRAASIDPHSSASWLGLARCSLRQKKWRDAEERALNALSLEFERPFAHVVLGLARYQQGKADDAKLSLLTASKLSPNWPLPRRLMTMLQLPDINSESSATARVRYRIQRTYLNEERREKIEELIRIYFNSLPQEPDGSLQPPLEAFERHRMIVVSGLPRSGTSLMMQLLQAAGVPVLSDERRTADADNPRGYLEWEGIKELPKRPEVLCDAGGKALKVVSPMIAYLPVWHRYDVIFLDRDIDEVLASQSKMRQRHDSSCVQNESQMREAMKSHRDTTLDLLRRSSNVRLLVVPYQELVIDSDYWINRVAEFLSDQFELDKSKMSRCIDPHLYRNRSISSSEQTSNKLSTSRP